MKKIKYITVGLLGILSFTGCEKFLEDKPESVLTQVDFYTTPTRINQGVLGCYGGLANVMKDEWMFTELRSDNTCVSSTGSSSSTRQYLTHDHFIDLFFFNARPLHRFFNNDCTQFCGSDISQ